MTDSDTLDVDFGALREARDILERAERDINTESLSPEEICGSIHEAHHLLDLAVPDPHIGNADFIEEPDEVVDESAVVFNVYVPMSVHEGITDSPWRRVNSTALFPEESPTGELAVKVRFAHDGYDD